MARRYFDKFPEIRYDGVLAKNLTVGAKLINKYASFPYTFTPFTIDKEQRADQVANEVYDDPHMSWMLYYANKKMDPYYDWFLPEQEFNDFLLTKYDSIRWTNRKILGFRTNWYEDSRELPVADFNHMFGTFKAPHSFYWNPVYGGDNNRILYYRRKSYDNFVNTNKLCKVLTANNTFAEGDIIDIYSGGIEVGSAEVSAANSSTVFLKNVLGDIDTGYSLAVFDELTSNAVITEFSGDYQPTATTWTRTNIDDEEYIYWSPYTVWDMEHEKNEDKKVVKIVDPSLAIKVADRLEDEIAGRR